MMWHDESAIPQEVRLAIGDVILETTKVEVQLAQIARHYEREEWPWTQDLLSRSGAVRNKVRALFDSSPAVAAHGELKAYYDRAVALINRRHELTHSPFMEVFSGGDFAGHHTWSMKTGDMRPVVVEELQKLASDLDELARELRSFRPTLGAA